MKKTYSPGVKIIAMQLLLACLFISASSFAASGKEIDLKVDETLKEFRKHVAGGDLFLNNAKGVLVFPEIVKAGIAIGGEYGEGALRINNKTVDYYSTASASFGLQFGVQTKSVIIVFLDANALTKFRESNGWKAGVDGSVALVELGTGKSIDTATADKPIVGFIFNNKGLMYNLTLEGSKFTKLKK